MDLLGMGNDAEVAFTNLTSLVCKSEYDFSIASEMLLPTNFIDDDNCWKLMFMHVMSMFLYWDFQNMAGAEKPLPISRTLLAESRSVISPTILHSSFCASSGFTGLFFQYPKFNMLLSVAI